MGRRGGTAKLAICRALGTRSIVTLCVSLWRPIVANVDGRTVTSQSSATSTTLWPLRKPMPMDSRSTFSANSLSEVDSLVALGVGPVAVVLPPDMHGKQDIHTTDGTRVVVCPATCRDDVTCADCMLCQRQRKVAVGFPAHGAAKRTASNVASRIAITRNAA
jgi:hypothetical protein